MTTRQDNRYINNGQNATYGGIINNIGSVEPQEELEYHCAFSATFVPGAHFDPPGCTDATQQRIVQTIEEWIDRDGEASAIPSGILYLHGPGAGQLSALVQSVAEKFAQKDQLAASFFASQKGSERDIGHQMIPTLVLGLVEKFEINFAQDGIRRDRHLFKKSFPQQLQKLLVKPLLALNSEGLLTVPHPQLIVIDRLDECDAQVNLFSAIAQCIPQLPYPFRFLITDRTTKRITGVLDRNLETVIREYYLGNNLDADVKIHTFLETEFQQIRRARPSLPRAWPEQKDVTSLVQRCSGDSIYASTAIEVIRSPNHGPEERLKVVLNLQPPSEVGNRLYDALYALLFQEMESREREKVALVLGALYFTSRGVGYFERLTSDYATIERILLLEPGEIKVLLNSIAFLIQVGEDGKVRFKLGRQTLIHYLLDSTRNTLLPFDCSRVHELAATYLLEQKIEKGVCDMEISQYFVYHCQYAHLNETLRTYLLNMEFEFTSLQSLTAPSKAGLWVELPTILWYIFRTFSREDFDPTRRCHNNYSATWYRHFLRSGKFDFSKGNLISLKGELDKILTYWKPSNFNPISAVDHQRRSIARPEHDVFSNCALGNSISSFIDGKYFMHSYDLLIDYTVGVGVKKIDLNLRTYSRDGKLAYWSTYKDLQRGVQAAIGNLDKVGKHIFSDSYQRYGIEPDDEHSLDE